MYNVICVNYYAKIGNLAVLTLLADLADLRL